MGKHEPPLKLPSNLAAACGRPMKSHPILASMFGLGGLVTSAALLIISKIPAPGATPVSTRTTELLLGILIVAGYFGSGVVASLSRDRKVRRKSFAIAHAIVACGLILVVVSERPTTLSDIFMGIFGVGVYLGVVFAVPSLLWLWLFSPDEKQS